MKRLQLLLILWIVGCHFIDSEEVNCQDLFDTELEKKCKEISSSCSFYKEEDYHCVETDDCSKGNEDKCTEINPSDFKTKKCDLEGQVCKQMDKKCSEWRMNNIYEIDCTNLTPESGNETCRLVHPSSSPKTVFPSGKDRNSDALCKSYHKLCSTVTSGQTACEANIPNGHNIRCIWDTTSKCQNQEIYCGEPDSHYIGKNYCPEYKVSGDTNGIKKCIYKSPSCQAEYIKCENIPYADCESKMPLNGNDYDFSKKCVAVESESKCKAETRKCTEYYNLPTSISGVPVSDDLLNEEFCSGLEVTDKRYQRCAYNKDIGCYEEFTTCENYTNYKIETDRSCEAIVLQNPNQKCVYDKKEDTCKTIEKYSTCDDYDGKDKKTCESILSSETHQYCILDKDTKCIEKPINCSEAYTKDDCLHIAKASDSNKRCAYKGTKCVEEYIRCEDYIDDASPTTTSCGCIKLYDGKTCKSVRTGSTETETRSNYICTSLFKTCEDADTEEECKLIAKTGVTDPERRVCSWIGTHSSGSCITNYKYCSDYRRLVADDDDNDVITTIENICTRIKPYDELGNNIDFGFKCVYDDAGCQKTPVECSDAGSNPILCEAYSEYIKDKDKKYCFFDGLDCKAHYKKCEDFEDNNDISCQNNVIQGFTTNVCALDGGKCVQKSDCSYFSTVYNYEELICKSIHPNCSYSSPYTCEYVKDNKCEDIKFYSNGTDNNGTCESMEASKPYKKCVLKEDQSGCDEVYRESDFSTASNSYSTPPDASSQGNSSGFIKKGIHLIMVLLCLLI